MGFPGGSVINNPSTNAGDMSAVPGLGTAPGGGNGNPLWYSCLWKFQRERSLADYSSWGFKELDMTE